MTPGFLAGSFPVTVVVTVTGITMMPVAPNEEPSRMF
jgi:hypothetical protein